MVLDRSDDFDPRNQERQLNSIEEQTNSQKRTESFMKRMADGQREFLDQAVKSTRLGQRFQNVGGNRNSRSGINLSSGSRRGRGGQGRTNGIGGLDVSETRRNQPSSTGTKISNFRDGLVNPIRDFLEKQNDKDQDREETRFKREIFQFSNINKNLKLLLNKGGGRSLGQIISSAFNNFLRAPIISTFKAITPIVKGAFSAFGSILFGKKNKRDEVKAIDEQTEFLRKGFVDRSKNIFERLTSKGILGSAVSSTFGALTGISQQRAQQAEKSLQEEGKSFDELSLIEKASRKMFKSNINLLDQTQKEQQTDREIEEKENNLIDTQNALITNQTVSQRGWFSRLFNSVDLVSSSINTGFASIVSLFTGANFNSLVDGFSNFSRNMIDKQEDQIRQLNLSNSPFMTEFERESLKKLDLQNEKLSENNEIQQDQADLQEKSQKGNQAGLVGAAAGGAVGIGKKIVPLLKKAFTVGIPAVGTFLATSIPLLFTKAFALAFGGVALAGVIGAAIGTYIVNPLINLIDDTFGTEIGNTIGFITFKLVEAVKSIGNVILNPIDSIGTAVSFLGSKILSGISILGGFVIDGALSTLSWLGSNVVSILWDTFTWLGGIVFTDIIPWLGNKFLSAISSIFTSIGGQILDLASSVPILGRFIDSGEKDKEKKKGEEEESFLSQQFSRGVGILSNAVGLGEEEKQKKGEEEQGLISGAASSGADFVSGQFSRGVGILGDVAGSAKDSVSDTVNNKFPEAIDSLSSSITNSNEENKKETKAQREELVTLREQSNEQNERMLKVLEDIGLSSAETASKTGSDGEERVFLRKENQFKFNGETL